MNDDARHRIAVEAPADRARHDRVVRDVGGNQPEVDDGVQRPREQHAREAGVDGGLPAERDRQDLQQDFERRADRGPCPQIGARHVGEHRERHGLAGIGALPDAQVHVHQRDPDPRADHHQHDADVIERTADHRRIEGVEHRGLAQRDRHHRDHRADRQHEERGPRPFESDQRLARARVRRSRSRSPSRRASATRRPSPSRARSPSDSRARGRRPTAAAGCAPASAMRREAARSETR